MHFLKKLADIAVSGRYVGDMSATFPAKFPFNLLKVGADTLVHKALKSGKHLFY